MRRRYPYRRRRYYQRGGGDSCLRDACLLDVGCCIGEALGDSCLMSGLLLLPAFAGALRRGGPGTAGRGAARLIAAIRVYQTEISAHRPAVCRYEPSCSAYAVQALQRHGAWRGTWLAALRLVRCRPGGRRGPDPVPVLTTPTGGWNLR